MVVPIAVGVVVGADVAVVLLTERNSGFCEMQHCAADGAFGFVVDVVAFAAV